MTSSQGGLAQQSTPRSVLQFVIVGKNDMPIFDADLTSMPGASPVGGAESGGTLRPGADGEPRPSSSGAQASGSRPQYLYHFILHAALDAMDDAEWTQKHAYLGTIDRFNNLQVAGYIIPGNRLRLMLLHDGSKVSEELVKMFFRGVHQLLIPVVLNPFFLASERLRDAEFYDGVRLVAKTVLGA
jgi:hypothetical protein